MGKRLKPKPRTSTTKKVLWFVLINSVLWVWDSHALAWVGMLHPAEGGEMVNVLETLNEAVVTGILVSAVGYFLKSLFEKRKDFGEVGKEENNERTLEETSGKSDFC